MPKTGWDWFKAGWVVLLLSLLAFSTGYGAKTQTISEQGERIKNIEENYVPKDEYRQILIRLDSLSQELKDFRIEQARLHGVK